MGAEIIKRKAGKMPEIERIEGRSRQVSFNSDGRIVVRYFDSQDDDVLIVFDERTSYILRRFIQRELSQEKDGIPF